MNIEEQIGALLKEKNLTLSVAESCTGGLLGDLITNVSGSSDYFVGGIIAYDNRIKIDTLGISQETITTRGAVSEETAREMAQRVREKLQTDIGVSVTGIAGPTGGAADKPVGLVWIALADEKSVIAKKFLWNGNRIANKQQSAHAALELIKEYLTNLKINLDPEFRSRKNQKSKV